MTHIRYILLAVAVASFSLAAFLPWHSQSVEQPTSISITPYQAEQQATEDSPIVPLVEPANPRIHYFVKVGDTLSEIFSSWNIPYQTLQQLLEADLSELMLDTIKPGDHIELELEAETQRLLKLVYHKSLVEEAHYTVREDNSFAYEFVQKPGQWKQKLFMGVINGSFSLTAHQQGLNSNQVANITRILKDKINFSRQLRVGDKFYVLINQQYLGNHLTGNTEILGISFSLRGDNVDAFLAQDGRFYDREGNSLEQAFERFPVDKPYRRITSAFNPHRKHPVTGRVTPHNGTDFATPVGAPVYSTGDGRVIAVRNHPYAGKYLVIEHNSVYKTRYLHLHRFLVKKGDYVKRGQKIALSGATGRLTGPHLHFEVLVRDRAVDPMKADLPLATSIPKQQKAAFLARISSFDQLTKQDLLTPQDQS
ncbi:peptidoglycan DD-metalloendopeptidase family protein [Vibrio hippocampi]|uniref:Murein DD-endopeptidase MepM n=1 Tax=Vibrio hippocampi TaxID=654686 RepID=A0ABM8ZN04_9VIBR|nr:peptidoglycan DD-metalloendopeptidase family protein [Vibrio hippocampi]CAH0529908.1 Murein DD-endopeptidase MepM [Vibrio hippocampi]